MQLFCLHLQSRKFKNPLSHRQSTPFLIWAQKPSPNLYLKIILNLLNLEVKCHYHQSHYRKFSRRLRRRISRTRGDKLLGIGLIWDGLLCEAIEIDRNARQRAKDIVVAKIRFLRTCWLISGLETAPHADCCFGCICKFGLIPRDSGQLRGASPHRRRQGSP